MKVLYFIQFMSPNEKNGGSKPWFLAKALAQKGHKINVIISNKHYLKTEGAEKSRKGVLREEKYGVQISKINTSRNFRKSFYRRLLNYFSYAFKSFMEGLRIAHPDIVLASIQPIFVGPVGFIIAKLRRAEFVLEVRDIWPDCAIALGMLRSKILIKLSSWLEIFLYKNAKRIISLTPGITQNIISKGIDPKKVITIPNGFDDLLASENKIEKTRDDLGWEDKFIVIYTGSHARSDKLITLLKTARQLKENPNIKFILVGDGDKKRELVEYAKTNRLDNVEFLPHQSRLDVRHLLHNADICAMTLPKGEFWSIFFQNKFFDYLGAGKPIVASVIGDQKELIEKANTGICVEPENYRQLAEAILSLYQNKTLVGTMGNNGRNYVLKHYKRSSLVENYIQLLEGISGN